MTAGKKLRSWNRRNFFGKGDDTYGDNVANEVAISLGTDPLLSFYSLF
jgi:hypothetical protein